MNRKIMALLLGALCCLTSCIENDLPLPTVELNIQGVEGEGFTMKQIDVAHRQVILTLDEKTDIQAVKITDITISCTPRNNNLSVEDLLPQVTTSIERNGIYDLSQPLDITLSLYADYTWQIVAEQEIPLGFAIGGQVGAPHFDRANRIATAYVAKETDRTKVDIQTLKLGPQDITTYSPSVEELSRLDYSAPEGADSAEGTPHFVDVTCHARTERWTLYVLPSNSTVRFDSADAWSRVLWLSASGVEGQEMGFRYRATGTEEWTKVEQVKVSGGSFSACVSVQENSSYDVVAYCGSEETDIKTLLTEDVRQLPNCGMENWSTIKNVVYPYLEEETPFWGTGNVGAKIVNTTLTQGASDPRPGSEGKTAAHLKSKYANAFGIGKFAAGNLFTGVYVENAGTNGILTFGREHTQRPTALRLWLKFKGGKVDRIGKQPVGQNIQEGDPDHGFIYVALGTWTPEEYGHDKNGRLCGTASSPICVDTRDVKTFFNPQGKDVVGYGEKIFDRDIDTWTQITIPIDYADKSRKPTHIMVVCTASRWGDYFTGSTTNEMYIDDIELVYDKLD